MEITFLSTSDLHGYIFPTDFTQRNQSLNFGGTKVKALLDKITSTATGPVIKIDNGDFLQGSPLSYYAAKKAQTPLMMAQMMNQMGFDVGVIGNHEFNYGLTYLKETMAALNYPIVCANVLTAEGDYLTGQPYVILEREGVKIAVLGLVTPYIPHWEQPQTVAGLVFKSAVATAQEFVPKLRELAEIVVVSYHGGFERDLITGEATEVLTGENEGYQLLTEVSGIDVFLTGHQHRELALVTPTSALTQPGDKGRFVGEVVVDYDQTQAEITQRTAQLLPVTGATVDSLMTETFTPFLNEVETWLDQKMGEVKGSMVISDPMKARAEGHSYLEFIQQVQLDATGATISGTALFDNNGKGFGSEITMRDIVTNYIYPNTLAVLAVSGAELKAALERSASYFTLVNGVLAVSEAFTTPKVEHYNYDLYAGIDYEIDLNQPVGERITRFDYQGQPITPEQQLEIVINQYRAVGGGNYTMFGAEKIVREVTVDMTELISEYIQKHPVIEAQATTNFKLIY